MVADTYPSDAGERRRTVKGPKDSPPLNRITSGELYSEHNDIDCVAAVKAC